MNTSKRIFLTELEATYAIIALRAALDLFSKLSERDREMMNLLLMRLTPLIDLSEDTKNRVLRADANMKTTLN